jgi:hypothetical protein
MVLGTKCEAAMGAVITHLHQYSVLPPVVKPLRPSRIGCLAGLDRFEVYQSWLVWLRHCVSVRCLDRDEQMQVVGAKVGNRAATDIL